MAVSAVRTAHTASPSHKSHPMKAAELGAAFTHITKGLTYMSESDYPYEFATAKDAGGAKALSAASVLKTFAPALKAKVFTDPEERKGLTIEVDKAAETKKSLHDWGTPGDPNDPQQVKDAKKLATAFGLYAKNVTDVHSYKVGPKEDGSNKLSEDQGLYAYLYVGRTRDGKLAAVIYGSVET